MDSKFTRRETTHAIMLIEIAVLIVLLVRFGDRRTREVELPQVEVASAAVNVPSQDSMAISPRPFDPNTVTYEELRALGMSRREAVSLIKFRATGKVFRIKEDVALCYNISDSAYSAIAPYIVIGEEYRIKPNANYSEKKHTSRYSRHRDSVEYEPLSPFRIDTVSVAYLRSVGVLTKRQAEVFVRWRDQSGFRDMEEVRACYVVDDSIAALLEPYIIFPERELSPFESPVDLNTADSAQLIKVVGIGPKTVGAIIRYRERLGGYYSAEQLTEVQGVTESNYEKIIKQIRCDSKSVRRIDINIAVARDLIHPYINKIHIRKIIRQRQLSGEWRSIQEMVDQRIFTSEEAARIEPYMVFRLSQDSLTQ